MDDFIHPGEWYVSFEIDDSVKLTGGGDAFVILSTVIKVMDEFIKNFMPPQMNFTAMKDNNSTSRIDLYRKMVQKMAGKAGYSFEEARKNDQSVFVLKRKM